MTRTTKNIIGRLLSGTVLGLAMSATGAAADIQRVGICPGSMGNYWCPVPDSDAITRKHDINDVRVNLTDNSSQGRGRARICLKRWDGTGTSYCGGFEYTTGGANVLEPERTWTSGGVLRGLTGGFLSCAS